VRASALDFELVSNVNITRHVDEYAGRLSDAPSMTLWHVNVNPGDGTVTPTANFRRVATVKRPRPAQFRRQLRWVEWYADLREDRGTEILAQMGPPIAFWSSIIYLHPDRRRWTLEFLDVALRFANFVEMRIKHGLASRRPIEYSPQVQPMILSPGHSAFPSGHATEAFTIAYLLWRLMRAAEPAKNRLWCEQLMRQAARVAINRTVAGVHFPVDSAAGELLGLALGRYLYHLAQAGDEGAFVPARFDGEHYNADADFRFRDQVNTNIGAQTDSPGVPFPYARLLGAQQVRRSRLLRWLWRKARAEWP
jgi:hypothetical protein